MKTRILLPLLLLGYITNSQAQIKFDLADDKTKTETIDIDKDPVVEFQSLLTSKYRYEFEVEMKEDEIPAFGSIQGTCDQTAENAKFLKALSDFEGAKNESEVPPLYSNLENEMKKLDANKYSECIRIGTQTLESSRHSIPLEFALRYNQTITVTAKRFYKNDKGKDTSITWVRVFKTPEKSPWSIMYGFTYVPNLMNPVTNYYSKEDTVGRYTITPLNNGNKFFFKNISPTIMLTWTPMSRYRFGKSTWCKALVSNNFYQFGFTAGISANFSSEASGATALIAPSLVIGKNVSLSFGPCITQKQVLKGQYKEGDVVKENLDFDQLHEKQFMAEWFFSLAIRFEKSPFDKKEADSKD